MSPLRPPPTAQPYDVPPTWGGDFLARPDVTTAVVGGLRAYVRF
jgi:hypothetical protein